MPVSRKPAVQVDAVDVEALINKGGRVPQGLPTKDESSVIRRIQLRLGADLIAKIDAARKSRTIKPSRHTWLLEAIHDKLTREQLD